MRLSKIDLLSYQMEQLNYFANKHKIYTGTSLM